MKKTAVVTLVLAFAFMGESFAQQSKAKVSDNDSLQLLEKMRSCKEKKGLWDEKGGFCKVCEKKPRPKTGKGTKSPPRRPAGKIYNVSPIKVPSEPLLPPITQYQWQSQSINYPPVSQAEAGATPAAVATEKPKWFFIGPGVWALGTYMSPHDFMLGPYVALMFAVNYRFRLGANIGVGFGPWEPEDQGKVNLWLGALAGIRAYKGLFIDLGLESVWGGFSGLTTHRRMFFFSVGPEYWFGDRGSISLRFIFGVWDEVCRCVRGTKTDFAGGNIFSATFYF